MELSKLNREGKKEGRGGKTETRELGRKGGREGGVRKEEGRKETVIKREMLVTNLSNH